MIGFEKYKRMIKNYPNDPHTPHTTRQKKKPLEKTPQRIDTHTYSDSMSDDDDDT